MCFHFLPHPPTLPTLPTLHGPPGSPLRSAATFMHDSLTSPGAQLSPCFSLQVEHNYAHLLLLLSPPVTSLKP